MYADKQQKQQYDDVSSSHSRMKWCGKCTRKHLLPFVSCFNYSGIYEQPQHQLQHNVGYSPSLSNSPIIPTTVSSRCGKILLGRVLPHAPEPPARMQPLQVIPQIISWEGSKRSGATTGPRRVDSFGARLVFHISAGLSSCIIVSTHWRVAYKGRERVSLGEMGCWLLNHALILHVALLN